MRRRKLRYEPKPDDGLVAHPSGLHPPGDIVKIARAKMDAMENHPGLAWLRAQDEAERCPPRGVARIRWWEAGR
jgi:hypothetical protein